MKRVGGDDYLRAREGMPYLVQRVLRRDSPSRNGVDRFFSFDYMGSSEFEWGALPAALREMRNGHELVIKSIRDGEHTCAFLGRAEDVEKAKAFFVDQLGARKTSLKEATLLRSVYAGEKFCHAIGWWALDQECPWLIFKNKADAYTWQEGMAK